jgi:hypothetical protein
VIKVANSKYMATLELFGVFRHFGGHLGRWPSKRLFSTKSAKVATFWILGTLARV